MRKKKNKPLSALKNMQSGVIVAIQGGEAMIRKLEALGMHLGASIQKKNKLYGIGPVIVTIGNTEIALGYGMATRILVEVDEA